MQLNLTDLLDVVLPSFPEPLASRGRREHWRLIGKKLPLVSLSGFEVRLAGGVDADLLLYAHRGSPHFGATIRRAFEDRFGSPRLDALIEAMRDEDRLGTWLDNVWLEFDGVGVLPCLFFGIENDCIREAGPLEDVVAQASQLLGYELSRDIQHQLRQCVEALPASSGIFQLGLLLSRGERLRVCVSGPTREDLLLFAQRLQLGDISAALSYLEGYVDGLNLSFDLPLRPQDIVGVEGVFSGQRRSVMEPRWRQLLNRLAEDGRCAEAVRDALAIWPGVDVYDAERWPPAWRSAQAFAGSSAYPVVLRGLHHIKLSVLDGSLQGAKAYIGAHRRWTTSPSSPSRGADAYPRSRDPIERALNYLECRRNEDGWWTDFELAAGPSDEWVTAFVGACLCGLSHSRAFDLALSAWLLLENRRRSVPGWGYNGTTPIDSDSTSWALLLARRVGVDSVRVRTARRKLLEDWHDQPGVGTYRDPREIAQYMMVGDAVSLEGWAMPDTSVTAAAVLALGRAGSAEIEEAEVAWKSFLRSDVRQDGRWTSRWWEGDMFATVLALSCFRGQVDQLAESRCWLLRAAHDITQASVFDAFSAAWCIHGLSFWADDGPCRRSFRSLRDRLWSQQQPDGSWVGSARLRVPPPPAASADAVLQWDIGGSGWGAIVSDRGVFTTAAVVSSLQLAGRLLDDRPTLTSPYTLENQGG